MKINGYSRTKKLCESMFYCAQIKSRIEQFSIESNVHLLWFCLIALRLVKKKQPHFLNQSKVKPKPIPTCSQSFRAWRQLHVFACRSEWFIALFVCCNWEITTRGLFTQFTKIHKLFIGHKLCYVLYIGQSNCFCFAITALKKTALTRDSNLLTASKKSIKTKLHISC